ncbi:MAG: 3 beta-hydroxysteroid dehydrogenase/Delta 5--_4-isomerase [Syntrophaceae bacterium PtaU1.Bin231]|nr:MAG: 3 beta-hydroxysteroid dehydrogenase/Delta 5-->4-isomerase [Syntrophaceae bacterium PtaU1.Bin231]
MTARPLVLITGATGAVGPLVVGAFHDEGYAIRTLSLDHAPMGAWPADIDARSGDVTDPSAVQAAMEGVDAVVHLAALLHIVNPLPALREKYERINVGGTSTVVAAAVRAGAKRIVLFSTIAVYGSSGGRIVTEETPPYPDTFYARTKLAAEQIVLGAKGADGRNIGTVLRLAAVYGSRIKGNYQRLVRSLAGGRFLPVGDGSNRRTLVYDKDVARAAVLAAFHDDAAGNVFNVTDGSFHEMSEIVRTICAALGRREPRLALPVSPVRRTAGLLEDAARFCGFRSPVTRSTIDKYTEDIAVDGGRIQRKLGFRPRFDLTTGWTETIREMRSAGSL